MHAAESTCRRKQLHDGKDSRVTTDGKEDSRVTTARTVVWRQTARTVPNTTPIFNEIGTIAGHVFLQNASSDMEITYIML